MCGQGSVTIAVCVRVRAARVRRLAPSRTTVRVHDGTATVLKVLCARQLTLSGAASSVAIDSLAADAAARDIVAGSECDSELSIDLLTASSHTHRYHTMMASTAASASASSTGTSTSNDSSTSKIPSTSIADIAAALKSRHKRVHLQGVVEA